MYELDSKGICVSTGSACSSGDNTPSHVLTSIGLDEDFINGAVRVTFGEENKKEDVDILIKSIKECVEKLKQKEPR